MDRNIWEQLNVIRLALAATVAVGHAVGIFLYPFGLVGESTILFAAAAAEFAVLSFFVISGFAIGRSLRKRSQHEIVFLPFMAGRIIRIYPPLLFSVVVTVLLAALLQALGLSVYLGSAPDPMRMSFSYLDSWSDVLVALLSFGFRGGLTGSSNGPLWSLALEMQAYVIAGLVVQMISVRHLALKALSAAALIAAIKFRGIGSLNAYEFMCLSCFLVGAWISLFKVRLGRIFPTMGLDFSYSLYILHFPTMLFVFFLTCQGSPQPGHLWLAAIFGLGMSLLLSIASGIVFERRAWLTLLLTPSRRAA